jgi:hypothetical protein
MDSHSVDLLSEEEALLASMVERGILPLHEWLTVPFVHIDEIDACLTRPDNERELLDVEVHERAEPSL